MPRKSATTGLITTLEHDPPDDWLIEKFGAVLRDALVAFQIDLRYAEEMCRAAAYVDQRTCGTCGRVFGSLGAMRPHVAAHERRAA